MQRAIQDQTTLAAAASPGPASAQTTAARPPRPVMWAASLAIGGLVLGAIYLMIVRGDALMLDLSALSKFVWCF